MINWLLGHGQLEYKENINVLMKNDYMTAIQRAKKDEDITYSIVCPHTPRFPCRPTFSLLNKNKKHIFPLKLLTSE